MDVRLKRVVAAATVIVSAVAVSACVSGKIVSAAPAAVVKPCGTVNFADIPRMGYEADLAVVSYVLRNRLGCTVKSQNLTEADSWQAIALDKVDVILENWGQDDLKKMYIDDSPVAVEMGETGNQGMIGWYVPPWLAAAHPDVLDYRNLNKYADKFATSKTDGKGQLLDGDPSYVTNDEALVKNLGLDFTVEYAGSETALIQAFKTAQAQKTWMIGYFYEPQWFLSEVPLVHVTLPPYTAGCDADPKTVKCDYPPYDLDKIARKAWVDSGTPAATFIKNFSWTNADQDSVAHDIANKMTDDAAAKKWVDAHPDIVNGWLKGIAT